MDKEMDQSLETQNAQAVDTPAGQAGASRRKFTRGAVLGGAVVLSLGNRAAWSTEVPVCLSANTLASAQNYLAAGGVHASMSPSTRSQIEAYYRQTPDQRAECENPN